VVGVLDLEGPSVTCHLLAADEEPGLHARLRITSA